VAIRNSVLFSLTDQALVQYLLMAYLATMPQIFCASMVLMHKISTFELAIKKGICRFGKL